MRNLVILSIILLILAACEGLSDINYDEEYMIPVAKTVKTVDNTYIIHFDSVLTDSRCPQGAECFWEGIAGVRFTISDKGLSSNIVKLYTISSINKQMEWSDSVVSKNLKIKLIDLTPYPSLNLKFNYSDYRAKIKISKLNQ